MSRRVLAGIGAAPPPSGAWQPWAFLILCDTGGDFRVDPKDTTIDRVNSNFSAQTLDGTRTVEYFAQGFSQNQTQNTDDARLTTHWFQSAGSTGELRVGPMPLGDYLVDVAQGAPTGVGTVSAACSLRVYDGSGRSSGSKTLAHDGNRAELTTPDIYWDGFDDGNTYTAADWFNRTIDTYPAGRGIPVTVTDRGGAANANGMNFEVYPTAGTWNRMSYIRIWEPDT